MLQGRADQRARRARPRGRTRGCCRRARKIVAVSHVSNALGTINPVKPIIAQAHARGAVVLVDGAQAAPHLPIDVQALDCDFYVFSGHKMYGPTGIGVLYGKQRAARGDAAVPGRRRHDRVGHLREDALQRAALQVRGRHAEHRRRRRPRRGDRLPGGDRSRRPRSRTSTTLLDYATARVREIPGVRLIGNARHKAGVLSFVIEGVHPHDVGTILDQQGIAIRTGHHCAQPVMDRFGVPATVRASLAIYNTREDIDALVAALAQGAARCSADVRDFDRPLPGSDPRPQPPAAELPRHRRRRRRRRKATTRSAAIG